MFAKSILAVAVLTISSVPLFAQDTDDGPGRGVARISLLAGDASVRRGDAGEYVAAAVNAPLVVQDHLVTGVGSRVELQFDWANFLRISGNADVRMAELEFRRYIVQVARGTVTWRVLRDSDAYVEISTPSVSVRPVKRGTYRVTVNEDGTSEITVRSGEAEIFTPRGSERLRSGRTMIARGTAGDPEFRTVPEIAEDDWDRWNERRDRDLLRSRSYQYMSRDIYGGEDLDDHGRWVHYPSYGYVWAPRVAPGWAPYQYGRWAWVDWYGWTWVSYDPWGWAPYHYGRWFWNTGYGGWCWWPGRMHVRHYWSPAFVAFFGFGRVGVGVGFGWGRVGWVPLAPFEPYHRWWGRDYYGWNRSGWDRNRITVVNNINITNVYRNARVREAVTVVDQDGFRRGRSVERIRVHGEDVSRAELARGPVPLTPERESLRLAERETTVRGVDREGQRFFSNRQPAKVEKIAFDEQRRGMEQVARRTFEPAAVAESGRVAGESQRGWRSSADGNAPAQREESSRGWRRTDERPGGSAQAESRESRGGASGWRGFGTAPGTRSAEPSAPRPSESRETRGGDTGWRSFGAARVGDGAEAGRAERFGEPAVPRSESRSDGNEWRRLGSSRIGGDTPADASGRRGESVAPAPRSEGRSDGSEWRRFENRGNDTPRSEGRTETPRWDRPPSESPRSEPRFEGRVDGSSRGESIRISPPIVRERGDWGGRSTGGGSDRGSMRGGGSGHEAPAPSAPRGDFGGGGGRMSGGSDHGSMRGGGDGGGSTRGGGGESRGGGGGRGGAESRGGGRGR